MKTCSQTKKFWGSSTSQQEQLLVMATPKPDHVRGLLEMEGSDATNMALKA